MLNSSEEQSYWYLRLNGFFLLDNFVIHKSENIPYSSDADLLALRLPFVFEQIGGNLNDWDNELFKQFSETSLIGIICQVKGGAIGNKELFVEEYLTYNLHRFGFTKNVNQILEQFQNSAIATFTNELNQECQVAKLLISRDKPNEINGFFWLSLDSVYQFIVNRIQKYPKEKYRDRNFFSSIGLQTIIEINELNRRIQQ